MGNPPPLKHTFFPPNLSANICPNIIDQELLTEVTGKQMSGPFTMEEASMIFGDLYHSEHL